jgi:hypothetical protein
MDKLPFDFTWTVDEAGYGWADPAGGPAPPQPDAWHRALQPVGNYFLARHYKPLREFTGLFRTFADIHPGPDGTGIIRFADRFGRLGDPPPGFRLRISGWRLPEVLQTFDLQQIWAWAIGDMYELVSLWDLIRSGDRDRMSQRVYWGGAREVLYHAWPANPEAERKGVELIFAPDHFGDALRQFIPGDPFRPAHSYLNRRVNEWVEGAATPRLMWYETTGQTELKLVPTTLLAALWLQFADAVAGNRQYRGCKECGLWFEVAPETARTSRLFCSGPCRAKAYRGRQQRARELHGKGWSFKDIAEELGSDIPTVKKWALSKKRE